MAGLFFGASHGRDESNRLQELRIQDACADTDKLSEVRRVFEARLGDHMEVEAVAIGNFVHGEIYGRKGQPVVRQDGSLLDEATARDLERAGLVQVKMVRQYDNKMMPAAENKAGKAPAAGQDQPSSALQAAHRYPSMAGTLHLPKRS